ncbi:uncharacterized protein LOC134252606 [Saccostrea cucullata]|uniref:uncharacterized protein LOC134252606 n=1 Tax=Saccostrea cuccullata TaxID=36930 RepID=UPI002ED68571
MLRAPRKSKSKSPYARPRGQAAAAVSTAVRTMPRTQAAITRTRPQGTTATSTVSTATLPQVATIATGIPVNSVMEQAIQTQQDVVNEQGTGSTANPGTIHTVDSLALPLPFISTASPLGVHVSQSLKEKIYNNEFVHLNKLLFHDPTSTPTNQIVFEDGAFQLKPKTKEQKIVNISQWVDAFLIYGSIYLVKHPTEALSLFRYTATIKRGADNMYQGWQEYDIQFRLKKSFNSAISWASVDAELWLVYMQPPSKK